jgi:4,5-dihydroxyphthalate decarboxylase
MQLIDKPSTARTGVLPLSIAFSDYDRTRPLVDGRVVPAGIKPTYTLDDIGQFCHKPVYEEFDVAEMSLSWYVAARMRGEPVIALPVFPLRMPVQAYIFTRSDAPYTSPADLVGKRIGTLGYRFTVNLWMRGILQDEYGVRPHDLRWVSTLANEGAGFVYPDGVEIAVMDGADPEQLLLDGVVDAVFSPTILPGIMSGDARLRRLFPDPRAELVRYFAKTNIMPITHTVVVGEALLAREPWIAENLLAAFRAAQAVCDADYLEPKFLTAPDAVLTLEAQRRDFGATPYQQGLKANRHIIETLVGDAPEPGAVKARPDVDTLFAPVGND